MPRPTSSRIALIATGLVLAVTGWIVPLGSPAARADTLPGRQGFWTAEVAWDTANVHAQPNPQSEVRREVHQGELLRVAGQTPGIDGDGGTWWSTTEGFVTAEALREANGDRANAWQLPSASEAPSGFWVALTSDATVRTGPMTDAPIVGTLPPGTRVKVLGEEQDPDGDPTPWYRIDGGRYPGGRLYSAHTTRLPDPRANTAPPTDGATDRWLVVDRTAGALTLVRDGQARFSTYVSLGKAGVDTPSGLYHVLRKLASDDMRSDLNPTADHSYSMPGVPSVQYFTEDGAAIHGTYWHDLFGTSQSQGCINLTVTDAAYLYDQTDASTPLVILD